MGVAFQIIRMLTLMLAPITPFAAARVWAWLGMTSDLHHGGWAEGTRPLPPGRTIGRQEILFPRIEDEQIAPEVERLRRLTAG
jgi:methionyl-tRNA synthetase